MQGMRAEDGPGCIIGIGLGERGDGNAYFAASIREPALALGLHWSQAGGHNDTNFIQDIYKTYPWDF